MADSTNRTVRVLVVDADAEVGTQICKSLRAEGFMVRHATSAAQGLTMARQNAPSLMIVDGKLAGCSGYDFAQAVKREFPKRDVPIIFTCSCGDSQAIQEARKAGGLYSLSKPIDPSVLLELVDKSLWMPHLIRRHIESAAHPSGPKAPRVFSDIYALRMHNELR